MTQIPRKPTFPDHVIKKFITRIQQFVDQDVIPVSTGIYTEQKLINQLQAIPKPLLVDYDDRIFYELIEKEGVCTLNACPICQHEFGNKLKPVMCHFCMKWSCSQCSCHRQRLHPLQKNPNGTRYSVCHDCDTKYLSLQLNHPYVQNRMLIETSIVEISKQLEEINAKLQDKRRKIDAVKAQPKRKLNMKQNILKKEELEMKKNIKKINWDLEGQRERRSKVQQKLQQTKIKCTIQAEKRKQNLLKMQDEQQRKRIMRQKKEREAEKARKQAQERQRLQKQRQKQRKIEQQNEARKRIQKQKQLQQQLQRQRQKQKQLQKQIQKARQKQIQYLKQQEKLTEKLQKQQEQKQQQEQMHEFFQSTHIPPQSSFNSHHQLHEPYEEVDPLKSSHRYNHQKITQSFSEQGQSTTNNTTHQSSPPSNPQLYNQFKNYFNDDQQSQADLRMSIISDKNTNVSDKKDIMSKFKKSWEEQQKRAQRKSQRQLENMKMEMLRQAEKKHREWESMNRNQQQDQQIEVARDKCKCTIF